MTEAQSEGHAYIRDLAAKLVRSGYSDRNDALFHVREAIEDEEVDMDADALVDAAIADLVAEQRDWPRVTDHSRLLAAFAQLRDQNILARENWSDEVVAEMEHANAGGHAVDGYVFFHEQDIGTALDGGGLYLAFGGAETGASAAVDIGQRIKAALEAHGLSVDWNGEAEQRIRVVMPWQAPWPGGPGTAASPPPTPKGLLGRIRARLAQR